MLRATALARLSLNCQPEIDPKLTAIELDTILDMYALEDELGQAPDYSVGSLWLGAWDLRAASRKAWETKAAKIVGDVDYDVDGARYSSSQLHAHCLKQAERFSDTGVIALGVV